jgi:DNA-binding MarR family transcriptional regulator
MGKIFKIPRTKKTAISDGDLFILDLLWDGSVSESFLYKENIIEAKNISYFYKLSPKKIKGNLNRLVNLDLIKIYFKKETGNPQYFLTEKGGKIWEEERNPQWDFFCLGLSSPARENNFLYEIFCHKNLIGKRYAKAALLSNLWKFKLKNLKKENFSSFKIIYWKHFSRQIRYFVFSEKTETPDEKFCKIFDRKIFEKHRVWWSNLNDLLLKL